MTADVSAQPTLDEAPDATVPPPVREPLAPGVYDHLELSEYLADPAVSASGLRKLLPPHCPARFAWERAHPTPPSAAMDLGSAAHRAVLGVGPDLVLVDAADWRTNAAKDARDAAHARGHVPLLRDEHAQVLAMADALRAHPIASALLGDGGQAESSLFWEDGETGIMRRGRLDWRPSPRAGRTLGLDYKSSRSAEPEKFGRLALDYGYHQQAAGYLDGMIALGLADGDAQFLFLVQETSAPYLVSVVQLDVMAIRIGRLLNRQALTIYRECVASDSWPGYADDVAYVSLPPWYSNQFAGEL